MTSRRYRRDAFAARAMEIVESYPRIGGSRPCLAAEHALALFDAAERAAALPQPPPNPANGRVPKHYRAHAIIAAVDAWWKATSSGGNYTLYGRSPQDLEILAVTEFVGDMTGQQVKDVSNNKRRWQDSRRKQVRRAVHKHRHAD